MRKQRSKETQFELFLTKGIKKQKYTALSCYSTVKKKKKNTITHLPATCEQHSVIFYGTTE